MIDQRELHQPEIHDELIPFDIQELTPLVEDDSALPLELRIYHRIFLYRLVTGQDTLIADNHDALHMNEASWQKLVDASTTSA